jgi:hypothetical protein
MFEYLMNKYHWTPISGCPGRYILASGVISLSPQELVGNNITISEEKFDAAQDAVCYCYFTNGGLISYKKQNGFLHTLCTKEGMKRKMDLLKRKISR